jgi:hypothetical protein|nr:MAG TPA: hypothetical protein [Caudoviricetes sp.]
MKIFEKAMEIRNLYKEMQEESSVIGFLESYKDVTQFQLYDVEDFVKVALENNKKFEMDRTPKNFEFSTEAGNIGFIFLTDDEEEYNYILDQLF